MKKKFENILFKRYPNIFKQININPLQISKGIQCKSGWYDLIDIACLKIKEYIEFKNRKIEEENKSKPKTLIPSRSYDKLTFEACQIKSKFDGMRFYFDGGDDYISGIIAMTEAMSLKICEHCGQKLTAKIEFRCEKCRKN